ncbi:MAG: hypothetical protein WBF42_10505 [Terracidiphilus sp.]
MKLIRLLSIPVLLAALSATAQTPSRWAQPAAALADQVSAILGPGQVRFTVRNLSTIPADQLPPIQRLLEQDLKAHGIVSAGDDSANALRITLSESASERLWIAEIIEGKETEVAMVHVDLDLPRTAAPAAGITLHRQLIAKLPGGPILSVLEIPDSLITLAPEEIVVYTRAENSWREEARQPIVLRRPLPRDPRGMLVPTAAGTGFEAWLAGTSCAGNYTISPGAAGWEIHCHDSDDPWPILENNAGASSALKAFYNAGRNYFTGVVTPSLAVELPPFYAAALMPRPVGGAAMLIGGIDGKVQLVDNNTLKPIAGSRDWGSDFAALNSGCGSGTQIVASGSGEAIGDSLRAYELPALEAIPASEPIAMGGTVTALLSTPNAGSILAITRTSTGQDEVDRVTATCN